jgi:hypothetical protein
MVYARLRWGVVCLLPADWHDLIEIAGALFRSESAVRHGCPLASPGPASGVATLLSHDWTRLMLTITLSPFPYFRVQKGKNAVWLSASPLVRGRFAAFFFLLVPIWVTSRGSSGKLRASPVFCLTPMFRGSPNGALCFHLHPLWCPGTAGQGRRCCHINRFRIAGVINRARMQ